MFNRFAPMVGMRPMPMLAAALSLGGGRAPYVGAPEMPALMVPGPAPIFPYFPGAGGPAAPPPAAYPPSAGYPGGGACGPGGCPPVDPNFYAALAAYQCQSQQATLGRAMRAQLMAGVPQIKIGIGSALTNGVLDKVLTHTAQTFKTTPVVTICITDMFIARDIATNFVINDMSAARVKYLGDGVYITCDGFTPDSVHPPMDWPTVPAGTPVEMTVTNTDGADHAFKADFMAIADRAPGPCLG